MNSKVFPTNSIPLPLFSTPMREKRLSTIALGAIVFLSVLVLVAQLLSLPSILSLAVCLLFLLFVLFARKKDSLLLLFFLLPCGAMFDASGFTYVLNFSVALFFFRHCFLRGEIFCPRFYLLIPFFLYNLLLLFLRDQANLADIFGSLSNLISFALLLTFFRRNEIQGIDFRMCYWAFFFGLLYSALAGYLYSGAGISDMFSVRQTGLTRDANYLALFALVAVFSYDAFFPQRFSPVALLVKALGIFVGLLTTSKMFLLLLAAGVVLYLIRYRKEIVRNKKIFYTLLAIFLVFLLLLVSGVFNPIIASYLERFSGDLTTGRVQIAMDFLSLLLSSPDRFFLGASSAYYNYYNVVYNAEHMYLHCTYLELPVAYGLLGTAFFAWMGGLLVRQVRMPGCPFFQSDSFLAILIFLVAIAALPLLTSDLLPLSLLFLIVGYRAEALRKQVAQRQRQVLYSLWRCSEC